MDTKTFEYEGIRGKLGPLTNRSELLTTRIVRVLVDNVPGLVEASTADFHANPMMNHTSQAIWRFTNLARIVEIEGLGWELPGTFASKDEILKAWGRYLDDSSGFWIYLGDLVMDMSEPETPVEARPEHLLTQEQREDPKSSPSDASTNGSGGRKSRSSSGNASRRKRDASSITTTGSRS